MRINYYCYEGNLRANPNARGIREGELIEKIWEEDGNSRWIAVDCETGGLIIVLEWKNFGSIVYDSSMLNQSAYDPPYDGENGNW